MPRKADPEFKAIIPPVATTLAISNTPPLAVTNAPDALFAVPTEVAFARRNVPPLRLIEAPAVTPVVAVAKFNVPLPAGLTFKTAVAPIVTAPNVTIEYEAPPPTFNREGDALVPEMVDAPNVTPAPL